MPLQSQRGACVKLRKGLISTGKRKEHAGTAALRPYGLIINYELKEIQIQTEAP